MKNHVIILALVGLMLASCGKKNDSGELPVGFESMGDSARIDYMISHVTPDSVARFIIYGALGRNGKTVIDSLAIATNYAYEKFKGEELDRFSTTYDNLVESLPLADKMRIYALSGSEDPQGLGYRLGLEYLTSVRDNNKTLADVDKEMAEFKKACGTDTAMYRRVMIGFQTALKADQGKDVPEDIYRKYEKIF